MGAMYLTDLADVCWSAGLVVVEYRGWETRARGSGGYNPGCPDHVMVHHTASGPGSDPDGDVAYIAEGAGDAPLANLYLSRSGDVWVLAAGATNTNGSGSAPWPGGCPDDQMNTHAIGIEAANGGTGEPWPMVQQTAYLALCAGLCDAYGIPPDHVRAHAEWSPGRKIDPAGQSMYAAGSATWNMPAFRSDVAAWSDPPPTPIIPPPPETDDMAPFIITNTRTGQIILIYGDGKTAGLHGPDLPGYVARFGDPIPTDGPVCDAIISKG